MLPPRHSRRIALPWLALALIGAPAPAAVHAQDTLKVPATTTTAAPRVNLPAGTRITRPPVTTTVARPPAAATVGAAQQIVTVPNLAGRTVDEARRLLAAAGLEMGSVTDGSGSGTPGTVMQQQPRAGSAVAPKSDVRVWVVPAAVATTRPPLNRPPVTRPPVTEPAETPQPALVTVPRLAGRTVEDARALLLRQGLEAGAVAEIAGSGEPGTILRQSPQAGARVERKSVVGLWVVAPRVAQEPPADTPAPVARVTVPSVAGQTVDDARKTLAAAGLALGPLAEAAGTGTPGTVARQLPAAGSSVAPNARVRLWLVPPRAAVPGPVATRPDPPPVAQPRPTQPQPTEPQPTEPVQEPVVPVTPPVTVPPVAQPAAPADSTAVVPDVRRLALPQAREALAAAGFTAAFDAALADSTGWIVSAQQPSAGGRLASGSVVALLLDPPSSAPVAGAPGSQPPVADGDPSAPAAEPSLLQRGWPWLALTALLLVVAAAAAGARRTARAKARVLPVTAVRARLRMDEPARVAVEGDPFGPGRLRFRMNPGRSAARVAAGEPLFVRKEVSVD